MIQPPEGRLLLTPAQRAELDRRLELEEFYGEAGESWESVRREIEEELSRSSRQ
jgi:hypothetical protein